jgi:hypothetical protein
MRFVDVGRRALAVSALLVLGACGGGNSTVTTITGGGTGLTVSVDQPTGDNTTEVVVDAGPGGGFSAPAANLPYVTVTVCEPGSSTKCVTVDHVFLDTGSIGLRLLRSTVQALALTHESVSGGGLLECYPFVIGAVWGPVARADVRIGGEQATAVPIQLIDDVQPNIAAAPPDCLAVAEGTLMQSVGALQAKGVLGVGLLQYDCGLRCQQGAGGGGAVPYYACADQATCAATMVPPAQQVQNPVALFPADNNGTTVVMPAVPALGAAVAKGRLVFGIGTRTNNQLAPTAQIYRVDADPASASYLYLATSVGGTRFPFAYIDSGSNGLFFDDAAIATACTGAGGSWYCPPTTVSRSAVVEDAYGVQGTVAFAITSADTLFSTSNVAFANLGGMAGAANPGAFVWGMPFFYGRSVTTAIWGQTLATNGPWYAF